MTGLVQDIPQHPLLNFERMLVQFNLQDQQLAKEGAQADANQAVALKGFMASILDVMSTMKEQAAESAKASAAWELRCKQLQAGQDVEKKAQAANLEAIRNEMQELRKENAGLRQRMDELREKQKKSDEEHEKKINRLWRGLGALNNISNYSVMRWPD